MAIPFSIPKGSELVYPSSTPAQAARERLEANCSLSAALDILTWKALLLSQAALTDFPQMRLEVQELAEQHLPASLVGALPSSLESVWLDIDERVSILNAVIASYPPAHQQLDGGNDLTSSRFCDSVNSAALLRPRSRRDHVPSSSVGGVLVRTYLDVEQQAVHVAVNLADAWTNLRQHHADYAVPLLIDVDDIPVFDRGRTNRSPDSAAPPPADTEAHGNETSREQLLRAFLDRHYNGDAIQALHDLGRVGQIAIAHLDRPWWDDHFAETHHRALTDAEWARLVPHLSGYDEHVRNYNGLSAGPPVTAEFARHVLAQAGITGIGHEPGDAVPPAPSSLRPTPATSTLEPVEGRR
ncbi:hypothetical protein [Nonomuraea sp. NPDC049784]|uniref:hypothetical protein n=1 Tax=Nonomuraea sp. NPDC049784 TaxID=3154361 RepID=UPI0033C8D554